MKILLSLFFLVSSISCNLLDQDLAEKYSYEDPYYLGINDVAVSCQAIPIQTQEKWLITFDQILRKYRKSDYRFNFKSLRNQSRKKICGLIKFLQIEPVGFQTYGENEKIAFWMNTYHVMIINLAVEAFDEINEKGKPQKPEFRSLLNIGDKGLAIFDEYKWNINGRYLSLNQVEDEIIKLGGFRERVSLYRGMMGFGALPEFALRATTVDAYLKSSLYKLINENIFYDNESNPPTAILPGSLLIYTNDMDSGESALRLILSQNIDTDIWDGIITRDDLINKIEGKYTWELEYDPLNWNMAEVLK